MAKRHVKIPLQGGLGNQLFQLSALLSLEPESSEIECAWGKPRKTNGVEDIFYYNLKNGISRSETEKWQPIIVKGFNFILRTQLQLQSNNQKRLIRWAWEKVINILLKQNYNFQVSDELGYFSLRKTSKKNTLLHGYFQSYKYFENPGVISRMQKLELNTLPEGIKDYEILAEADRPLVVHVRRGDYRLENNFGLLGKEYYEEALNKIWDLKFFNKIWLFSDEPESAMQLIPDRLRQDVRVIPDLDSLPSTTLELMRLGCGYVIANSSFSWWGAALSRNSNVQVVAPAKWFKGMDDPKDLIPPNWMRIDSHFL